jgi:hypothetical protein
MKKIKEGLEVEVEKRVIFNDTAYFERKEQMVEDVKDAVAKVMANGGPIKDSIIGAETEPSRKSATLSGVQPQNADPLGLWYVNLFDYLCVNPQYEGTIYPPRLMKVIIMKMAAIQVHRKQRPLLPKGNENLLHNKF